MVCKVLSMGDTKRSNMTIHVFRQALTVFAVALLLWGGVCLVQWVVAGEAGPPQEVSRGQKLAAMEIGINLAGIRYWSPHWFWTDAFKSSGDWVARIKKTGARQAAHELRQTPDGWPLPEPGQVVSTLMCVNIAGHYPAGRYVITHDGRGLISAGLDAEVFARHPGRVILSVSPSKNGFYLRIDQSDPDDPIRGIKVWLPGMEDNPCPFHPLFMERIRDHRVIRFMDWARTNHSPVSRWSQRTTPESVRQTLKSGVALEYMIDLCNRLSAEPWFCMPHMADDDYVRRFAMMVKQRLAPELRVYLEYSNEVWNTTFTQSKWAQRQGLAQGLSRRPRQAALRFYAQRSVEIFKIWEDVFGDASGSRLVRVLASQHVSPWATQEILSWRSAYEHADALAIAPYFGGKAVSEVAAMGKSAAVEDVLRLTDASFDHDITKPLATQRELADRFGLRLIAYEGGQHLVARGQAKDDPALTGLLIAANRHRRMYDLYAKLFEAWSRVGGGDLFVAFSSVVVPSKHGSWGLLEYQDQAIDSAWKYKAVLDAIHGRLPVLDDKPETAVSF